MDTTNDNSAHEPTPAERENKLVLAVIQEIRHHINMGDMNALDKLIRLVPRANLIAFLPEDQGKEYS